MKLLLFLLALILITGCSIEHTLNKKYKGKTRDALMLEMGRPTRIDPGKNGESVSIYEKNKFLKPAPINTGQFQYDKFESPKAIKNELYKFYLNPSGVVEHVEYEVSYTR